MRQRQEDLHKTEASLGLTHDLVLKVKNESKKNKIKYNTPKSIISINGLQAIFTTSASGGCRVNRKIDSVIEWKSQEPFVNINKM